MATSLADSDAATLLELPDPLVVNPGRLSILMALASFGSAESAGDKSAGVEFVHLRRQTRLTDGNLACHARRLSAGGLIDITKQFRAGKPVTTYVLTSAGRQALSQHVTSLMSAIQVNPSPMPRPLAQVEEEDWVD